MSDSIANVLAPPSEAVPSLMDVYTRSLQAQKGGIDVQNALAAQKAGRAMQLATDSNTGIFDPQKAASIATQMGPEVAPAMADLLNASSDLRTRQLAQANAHTSLTARAAAGIAFNPSDANLDQWHTTLINNGVPPSMADADLAEYKNLSPQDRVSLAHQHLSAALDAKDAIERQWPTPSVQNFGGSVGGMAVKPGGPGQPPSATSTGPGTSLSLSPSEATGMVVSKDPNSNQEVKEPLATFLQRHGYTLPGQPAGRAQTTAPGAGTSPPAAPALPPPVVSGAPPDVAAKWDASTKQYTDANEAAGNYQQRIFPLVQAYNIIKSGTVTTGQSADAWNQIRGTLQTAATKMGWDAQSIAQANSEQLAKYTQQYINAQGMSARSDQALASAITGNPGSHISTLANEQVMPAMIGMERMRQMMLSDFKAQPGDKSSPRNFSDFSNTWQNTHDPRAFIFDMMGDSERTKMVQSMAGNDATSKAARKRFSDTLDIVERNPGIMGQAALPH